LAHVEFLPNIGIQTLQIKDEKILNDNEIKETLK